MKRYLFSGPEWSHLPVWTMQYNSRLDSVDIKNGDSITYDGCLRFTEFCWDEKHVNIIVKSTNSPTQGQPNPRKKS